MNSDLQSFLGFLFIGLLLATLLLFAALMVPAAILGSPFLAYFLYTKRPAYKQKQAAKELHDLYERAKHLNPLKSTQVAVDVMLATNDIFITETAIDLVDFENYTEIKPPPPVTNDLEAARYKDTIYRLIANPPNNDAIVHEIIARLGPYAGAGEGIFLARVPLTPDELEHLIFNFSENTFFPKTNTVLDRNFRAQKVRPTKYKGENIAYAYLKDTPLLQLADRTTLIPHRDRFEHQLILGGTGSGKSQLIQYLISKDLEEDCTIIVIDNQNQMIPKLSGLGIDMQYLSPNYPLALNIFDFPNSDHAAPLLQYVLSGLMNAPLTPKQELVFQFGVTLMLAVKGNIYTFLDLLGGDKFDLSGVDETTHKFFTEQYYKKGKEGYDNTRAEIIWRIWSLLKNPVLRGMFGSTENRCRLELDRKLILIDADINRLQAYTGLFGRFFLAQLLQLAHERFAKPGRPIYVYIDEAYFYLDQSVVSMLETARKAKVGLTIAMQYLDQVADPKTSAALMSLTSTKFAAKLSPHDARAMAAAMRTTPEFIQAQKAEHFALSQKDRPVVSIKVPLGVIEDMIHEPPDHAEMIRRYGRDTTLPPPLEPPEPPKPPASEDVSEKGEW